MKNQFYDHKISKFVIFWLPVILWMCVIFMFSAHPTGSASQVHWQDFVVKKMAHITEYAILTVLLFRAFRSTGMQKRQAAKYALVLAVIYAATDEFHQSFTPGREPTIRDVIIDTIGATLSVILLWKLLPKMPQPLKRLAEKLQIN